MGSRWGLTLLFIEIMIFSKYLKNLAILRIVTLMPLKNLNKTFNIHKSYISSNDGREGGKEKWIIIL